MDQSICKLTLVCPAAVADGVAELMLDHEPPIAGFTTFAAEGHGMSFEAATVGERVRGRVRRSVVMVVMPRSEADRLVEVVRRKFPVPHLAYWIEPILSCGRLADVPPAAADAAGVSAGPHQGAAS